MFDRFLCILTQKSPAKTALDDLASEAILLAVRQTLALSSLVVQSAETLLELAKHDKPEALFGEELDKASPKLWTMLDAVRADALCVFKPANCQ